MHGPSQLGGGVEKQEGGIRVVPGAGNCASIEINRGKDNRDRNLYAV